MTYIETPPVPCTRTTSPPFTGIGPFNALYAVTAEALQCNVKKRNIREWCQCTGELMLLRKTAALVCELETDI